MTIVLADDFSGSGLLDGRALTSDLGSATWTDGNALSVSGGEIDSDGTDLFIGPLDFLAPETEFQVTFLAYSTTPADWGAFFTMSEWDGTGPDYDATQVTVQAFRSGSSYRALGFSGNNGGTSEGDSFEPASDFPDSFPTATPLRLQYDGTTLSFSIGGTEVATVAMPDFVLERRYFGVSYYGFRLQDFSYEVTAPSIDAIVSVPSPLSAVAVLGYQDFTAVLGDVLTHYVVDVVDNLGNATKVPITSWQATLRTGAGSNYAQCVIPAVSGLVDALQDAVEFVVYRRARLPSGGLIDYEMARCPVEQLTLDQGPSRHTATLAGYFNVLLTGFPTGPLTNRSLVDVRAVNVTNGGTRIRCGIDWLLRPGRVAIYGDLSLYVTYINYYVNGSDQYMDVGSYLA